MYTVYTMCTCTHIDTAVIIINSQHSIVHILDRSSYLNIVRNTIVKTLPIVKALSIWEYYTLHFLTPAYLLEFVDALIILLC